MRKLNEREQMVIRMIADGLKADKSLLLSDLSVATVFKIDAAGAIITFCLEGYERPPYRGQRPFLMEGRMLDSDGTEISILLYADQNGRLFELEFIKWADGPLNPDWNSLEVVPAPPLSGTH